jgi:multidrug resistance efflux pump
MPPLTELLREKIIIGALGVVGLIFVGSAAYYFIESRPPTVSAVSTTASVTSDVLATGSVTPLQNPDLSFQVAGQVRYVRAVVGQKVSAGTLLATLDTGILSANYAAAQATLSGLAAGPRTVDVAGKQTSVQTAQTTLDNEYSRLASLLAADAGQAEDAVHATDQLYLSMTYVDFPHLSLAPQHQSIADAAGYDRAALDIDFQSWDKSLAGLQTSSPASIDAALDDTIARLIRIRTYFTDLTSAANDAFPELSPAKLANISSERASVNSLIVALTNEKQTLSSYRLAVKSANDALSLTQAGSPVQDIAAAQARVNAAAAALAQAEIVAPFSGTVASVAIKAGDPASPNTPAISLLPNGNLEVEVYLSEIDMTKLSVGDAADVTLDAYGATTKFPATVASIDRAPTAVQGVSSYKATLMFTAADSRISTGMHANAVIHTAAATTTQSR